MCWCDMFKIAVNPERGFSKSWHHMFVMSNICAFVLTWCLFVGNSRQTTSSVPWHRAPKYDRKHNLHLTIKRFLFKWSLISCMCRWRVCVASRETTVWIQEGELVKNAQSVHRQFSLLKLFQANQLQCDLYYATCMACLTWKEQLSCLLHLYKIPDS